MKSSTTRLSGCDSLLKHESYAPASTGKRLAEVQIVLNPRAGRGHGLVLAEPLVRELKRRGYRPSVLVTEDRGHARRWARECRQPPDYLISLAGDDTLNELAEVVIQHHLPIISPPLGFGNVCSQAFGHRAEVSAILNLLEAGRCIDIDAGLQHGADGTETFFVDVIIRGFVETIRTTGEEGIDRRSHTRRMAGYLLAAAKWMSSGQAATSMAIEVDGETVSEGASLALVANLPAFPGKLVFTPDADPCDGLLDLCVVLGDTKQALLAALCGLLLAAPSYERRLLRRRGRVVRIRPTAGGAQSFGPDNGAETVTVLPRAVPVLVPPTEKR
jgi:diacylglycerol kinase (ATP)